MATVHKTRCKVVENPQGKPSPPLLYPQRPMFWPPPHASWRTRPPSFVFLYAMRYAVSCSVPKHSPRARDHVYLDTQSLAPQHSKPSSAAYFRPPLAPMEGHSSQESPNLAEELVMVKPTPLHALRKRSTQHENISTPNLTNDACGSASHAAAHLLCQLSLPPLLHYLRSWTRASSTCQGPLARVRRWRCCTPSSWT